MKKYVKPSVTVVEFETGAPLLAAVSGEGSPNSISLFSDETNESNRAKGSSFDLWGDDED